MLYRKPLKYFIWKLASLVVIGLARALAPALARALAMTHSIFKQGFQIKEQMQWPIVVNTRSL